MKKLPIITLMMVLACLSACKAINSVVKEGDVVARVGKHKLYSSELSAYIPEGLSSEDSTKLAMQYINSWASDLLFSDIADKELSKEEKDVSQELETYRKSLLKFRYEHKFVNQRLDTLITEKEIEEYYQAHSDNFKLKTLIVKARFVKLSGDNSSVPAIKKILSSKEGDHISQSDSLVFSSVLRFTDYSERWIDIHTLARDFGTDYQSVIDAKNGNFIQIADADGAVSLAYITDSMKAGEQGPVEFFEEGIKDIILSTRKQKLLTDLERDLLEKARDNVNFEYYK